ncbi:MAG: NDP-sugar synthase [Acidimicrobiaceae bacterium]|nr:NDP-sugar synthase [Acidimicrobiaceae bacterium]
MLAIVLAGGFGTRLHPLTLTTPKQMLPVAGRPMIEHIVSTLSEHGVDKIVLSLGYRDDVFRAAYPDYRCAGVELVYAVETKPLGTAGAIRFAWEIAGKPRESFLVVNGDVITALDFTALMRCHSSTGAEATIHLIMVDDPSRYGLVLADSAGKVGRFLEKPHNSASGHCGIATTFEEGGWINAGSYVMEPAVIDRIPADQDVSIERDCFPSMACEDSLWSLPQQVYWIDAGTPESYLQVQLDILESKYSTAVQGCAPHIAEGVSVGAGARVERSVIMGGVSVGAGARVERSVIMENAIISDRALICDSAVGSAAFVGVETKVSDFTLLADNAKAEANRNLTTSAGNC